MPTVATDQFVKYGRAVARLTQWFINRHRMAPEDGTMLLLAAVYYWAKERGHADRLEQLSMSAWGGQRVWHAHELKPLAVALIDPANPPVFTEQDGT